MKTKILTLIFFTALFCNLNAQSSQWTKDARNMIYNELLNELTPYKDITQEQKESIALCGLDEITKKYTMSDYQSKIEVELKRIKSATIGQCSKNIGVVLENTPKQTTDVVVEEWSKEAKSSFYNEALSILSKYDDLTQQQKENISLCFSNEITTTYSKTQMNNMMDVELKRAKNDAFKKCLEKNNVTLKKTENIKLDKKSLIGCWQSYDFTICFFETGELDKRMDKGIFKSTKGKWFLESDKIIFVIKNIKESYKITFYNGESLKLEEEASKKEYHFTKMLNF